MLPAAAPSRNIERGSAKLQVICMFWDLIRPQQDVEGDLASTALTGISNPGNPLLRPL